MAKTTDEQTKQTIEPVVRAAIDTLLVEGRDVTTAAVLAWLRAAGMGEVKASDIHGSAAWQERSAEDHEPTPPATASAVPPPPQPKSARAGQRGPAAVIVRIGPPRTAALSKTEAVRQALARLGNDARPADIQHFIRSNFGLDVSLPSIYVFKSSLLKPLKSERKISPKPRRTATAPALRTTDVSLEDIRDVKALVDRLGADRVCDLAAVLAE